MIIMTIRPKSIALQADKLRKRASDAGALASVFEKSALQPKPNLLRCKTIVKIVIFNVKNNTPAELTEYA